MMDALVEHYLQVGLNCLQEVLRVGVANPVFCHSYSKFLSAYRVDLLPEVGSRQAIPKDNIEETNNSPLFYLILIVLPPSVTQHCVLHIKSENAFDGSRNEFCFKHSPEPPQPTSLVNKSEMPDIQPRKMHQFCQFFRVGEVLLLLLNHKDEILYLVVN